jgi:hypothetical protein
LYVKASGAAGGICFETWLYEYDLLERRQVRQAVSREHPSKAATVCDWSVAMRAGGDRQLRCVAVYLPIGVDLRLLEGDDFRRTKLCKDAAEAHELADMWRDALHRSGWSTSH